MRIRIDATLVRGALPWSRSVVCCFREIADIGLDRLGPEVYCTVPHQTPSCEFDLENKYTGVYCVDVYCCGINNKWPGVNHVQHGYFAACGAMCGRTHIRVGLANGQEYSPGRDMKQIMDECARYEELIFKVVKERTASWLEEVSHYDVGEALKSAGQAHLGKVCHIATALGPSCTTPEAFFFGALSNIDAVDVWRHLERCADAVTTTMTGGAGEAWASGVGDPKADFQWLAYMLCAYCHGVSYVSDHTLDMAAEDDIFESVLLNRSGDCEDMSALIASLALFVRDEPPAAHTLSPTLARLRAVACMYTPYVALVTLSGDEFVNTGHVVPILVRTAGGDVGMPGALLLEGTNMHNPVDLLETRKIAAMHRGPFLSRCEKISMNLPEVLLAPINRAPVGSVPKAPNFAAMASKGSHWYRVLTEVISATGQWIAVGDDGKLGVPFIPLMNSDDPSEIMQKFPQRRKAASPDIRAVSKPPQTKGAPWIQNMGACLAIEPQIKAALEFVHSLPAEWPAAGPSEEGSFATLVCGLWPLACNLTAVTEAIGNLRDQYGNVCVRLHNVDVEAASGDPVMRVSFLIDTSVQAVRLEQVALAARDPGRGLRGLVEKSVDAIKAFAPGILDKVQLTPVGVAKTLLSLAVPGPAKIFAAAKAAKKMADTVNVAKKEPGKGPVSDLVFESLPEAPIQDHPAKIKTIWGSSAVTHGKPKVFPVSVAAEPANERVTTTEPEALPARTAPARVPIETTSTEADSHAEMAIHTVHPRMKKMLDEVYREYMSMDAETLSACGVVPSECNIALSVAGKPPLGLLVGRLADTQPEQLGEILLQTIAALLKRLKPFRTGENALYKQHSHVAAFVQNSARAMETQLLAVEIREKLNIDTDFFNFAFGTLNDIIYPVSFETTERSKQIQRHADEVVTQMRVDAELSQEAAEKKKKSKKKKKKKTPATRVDESEMASFAGREGEGRAGDSAEARAHGEAVKSRKTPHEGVGRGEPGKGLYAPPPEDTDTPAADLGEENALLQKLLKKHIPSGEMTNYFGPLEVKFKSQEWIDGHAVERTQVLGVLQRVNFSQDDPALEEKRCKMIYEKFRNFDAVEIIASLAYYIHKAILRSPGASPDSHELHRSCLFTLTPFLVAYHSELEETGYLEDVQRVWGRVLFRCMVSNIATSNSDGGDNSMATIKEILLRVGRFVRGQDPNELRQKRGFTMEDTAAYFGFFPEFVRVKDGSHTVSNFSDALRANRGPPSSKTLTSACLYVIYEKEARDHRNAEKDREKKALAARGGRAAYFGGGEPGKGLYARPPEDTGPPAADLGDENALLQKLLEENFPSGEMTKYFGPLGVEFLSQEWKDSHAVERTQVSGELKSIRFAQKDSSLEAKRCKMIDELFRYFDAVEIIASLAYYVHKAILRSPRATPESHELHRSCLFTLTPFLLAYHSELKAQGHLEDVQRVWGRVLFRCMASNIATSDSEGEDNPMATIKEIEDRVRRYVGGKDPSEPRRKKELTLEDTAVHFVFLGEFTQRGERGWDVVKLIDLLKEDRVHYPQWSYALMESCKYVVYEKERRDRQKAEKKKRLQSGVKLGMQEERRGPSSGSSYRRLPPGAAGGLFSIAHSILPVTGDYIESFSGGYPDSARTQTDELKHTDREMYAAVERACSLQDGKWPVGLAARVRSNFTSGSNNSAPLAVALYKFSILFQRIGHPHQFREVAEIIMETLILHADAWSTRGTPSKDMREGNARAAKILLRKFLRGAFPQGSDEIFSTDAANVAVKVLRAVCVESNSDSDVVSEIQEDRPPGPDPRDAIPRLMVYMHIIFLAENLPSDQRTNTVLRAMRCLTDAKICAKKIADVAFVDGVASLATGDLEGGLEGASAHPKFSSKESQETFHEYINRNLDGTKNQDDPKTFLDKVASFATAAKHKAAEVWGYLVKRSKEAMSGLKKRADLLLATVSGKLGAWKKQFKESKFGRWLAHVMEQTADLLKTVWRALVEGAAELIEDITKTLREWSEINARLVRADERHAL
jgi:hypothetical protein